MTRLIPHLLSLALIACSGTATDEDTGDTADTAASNGGGVVAWEFTGLEPLGSGFVYEGWVIVDGTPVSTGRFNIVDDVPESTHASLTQDELDGAEAFVLTIEPEVGDDPGPADTKVLGGAFADDSATLSIAHPAALGDDFASAAGSFILQTPTTGSIADDYDQGIWWLDPSGGPGASLTLPTLPAGWTYEGWVVGSNGPVSTGTFDSASGADSDGGGATAGTDGAPPFPGQDYITTAVTLTGMTAVISIEPVPDDSAAPFAIKPLVDATIEDVGAGVLQAMTNNIAAAPTGTASLAITNEM